MNKVLSIPNDTIYKFKCSQCNNYLSHFPVFLIENETNVCGRCKIPEEITRFRLKIFEEFAKHIKFPCRYKEQGCCEELYPEEVPSHEKSCYFKLVECPGKDFISCSWKGIRGIMFSHCRETHYDMFLKDNLFELNLDAAYFSRNFLENERVLFRITLKHDPENKILKYGIYHVEESIQSENFPYQIVLSRDKVKIIFETTTTSFSERIWSEIALDSLTKDNIDQTIPISGSIVFEKPSEKTDASSRKVPNVEMLSFLKCTDCGVYVLPPIYQYEDGRIKCDACGSGTSFRNLNLDRIAKQLYYPCRYEKKGCGIVLKCEEMKKHSCPFEDLVCPYCDQWSGVMKNFKNHVLETHCDMLMENGGEIFLENCEDKMVCRIIHYADHLFEMRWSDFGTWMRWLGTVISLVSNDMSFKYQVVIKHIKSNDCLVMERECVQFKNTRDLNNDKAVLCRYDFYQILGWKETDAYVFKISVLKQ